MSLQAKIISSSILFFDLAAKCSDSPCKHGICHDSTGGYHCSCTSGYTGKNCDSGEYRSYCSFKPSYMEKNCDSKTTVAVVSPFYTVVVHQLGFTEKNCDTAEHSLYSSFT